MLSSYVVRYLITEALSYFFLQSGRNIILQMASDPSP